MSKFSRYLPFLKNQKNLLGTELIFLSLMIASLPSFEAPKNIFLIFFVITSAIRQLKTTRLNTWSLWDWIFLIFIFCAFLSAVFAGLSPGSEWGGFRMLLTYSCTGWLISRSKYTNKEISWIFWLTILSAFLTLIWGILNLKFFNTTDTLKLNSVGHVNHSAIYIAIIFGAILAGLTAKWDKSSILIKFSMLSLAFIFYYALLIGQSRGAFFISLITTFLIIVLSKNKNSLKIGLLALFTSILFLAVLIKAPIINKQIENVKTNNFLSKRDLVWNVSLEISRKYPLFGIGMNNLKLIKIEALQKLVSDRGEIFNKDNYLLGVGHSHSLYIQALVERGALGLGSIIFLMLAWLRELVISFKLRNKSTQTFYLWSASLGAWITTFGIGFINSTFHHEHGILACIFLGLFLTVRARN